MTFVLDTNVVSELRKSPAGRRGAGKIDRNVLAWSKRIPSASQFLSVVTIFELEYGTRLMERRDPRQGAVLRFWLDNHVLPAFAGRILPIDAAIAQGCAALQFPNPRQERDAFIAATALVHGMTVVTRNVSHFQLTGVPIINPWE